MPATSLALVVAPDFTTLVIVNDVYRANTFVDIRIGSITSLVNQQTTVESLSTVVAPNDQCGVAHVHSVLPPLENDAKTRPDFVPSMRKNA